MGSGILIAYATNSGSTVGVAEAIGEELAREGKPVEVRAIDGLAATDLSGYRAVVVGAPMILGWHRDATRFVRENRAALSKVPTAFFATAMRLTRADSPAVLPVHIDPQLARPPSSAGRLSFKERFTTPEHYLGPMLGSAGPARPVSVALFGGKLDYGRLKPVPRLFVMLVVGAQPGDNRNWDDIRAWSRSLRTSLG
jgi:menaquinone-dependent protoporphyrinogen IX oxidase